MKKLSTLNVLIILLLCVQSINSKSLAQMPVRPSSPFRITGWVDDTHYLFQTLDDNKRPVTRSVDIRTGRSVDVVPAKTEMELLSGSLPAGITIGTNDAVSTDFRRVVFAKDNDLYYFSMGDKELRRLTNDTVPEVNARFSPDGRRIAYTRNKDLYIFDLAVNKEIRLTFDASDRIYNGYASWVYMEEILGRPSRYAAFWWSPDGNKLSYLRTDEKDVPLFTLNRLDEADGIHGLLEQVPYPKAGDPNPMVKMGIADIASGKTTWVKTDYSVDQYIAWPFWTPDSRKLAIQVVNRDQNDIKIILADPATGDFTEIYNEKRKTWVEFYEDIYVMENGSGFIVRSYRNDWENLYFYGWDGKLISQITDFNLRVNEISRVDEAAKVVYFTGTGPESTDNHFFRIGLDGKNLLQVTKTEGTHNVSISPKGSYFIDTWNNIKTTGSIIAYDRKGKEIRTIHKFEEPVFDPSITCKS